MNKRKIKLRLKEIKKLMYQNKNQLKKNKLNKNKLKKNQLNKNQLKKNLSKEMKKNKFWIQKKKEKNIKKCYNLRIQNQIKNKIN